MKILSDKQPDFQQSNLLSKKSEKPFKKRLYPWEESGIGASTENLGHLVKLCNNLESSGNNGTVNNKPDTECPIKKDLFTEHQPFIGGSTKYNEKVPIKYIDPSKNKEILNFLNNQNQKSPFGKTNLKGFNKHDS